MAVRHNQIALEIDLRRIDPQGDGKGLKGVPQLYGLRLASCI